MLQGISIMFDKTVFLKNCLIMCTLQFEIIGNSPPPAYPPLTNFTDFVLQIFQRSLKWIFLFVKL